MTQRMVELEATIRDFSERLAANPENHRLERKLESAYAEYDDISAQLGGDRAPLSGEQPAEVGAPAGNITVPPDCIPLFSGPFTNDTDLAISATGTPTITSTITVMGAGAYLFDVGVFTDIDHTFSSDLDITVTSPAGTVVTLTTDNGSTLNNIFAGTTWDDDANPLGQVPFTTNNNTVTDHNYVADGVVTPLTPEEALAAFIGENPNGTWTLTISDDANQDGGLLDSWSLNFVTLGFVPTNTTTTVPSANVPVVIPSGQPSVVTSTIAVAGLDTYLCDVNALTTITHSSNNNLDITLRSPAGTVVTLTTDNGGTNANVFNGTTWDDDANPLGQVPYATNNGLATDHLYANNVVATPLAPEEPLGAFIGENPNGTWTLSISDDTNGMGGNLNAFSLQITTCTCVCMITCPPDQFAAENPPNSGGAIVNYPPPTTTGNCQLVLCSPASGSFFPLGTTTVTCSENIIGREEGNRGTASCSFTVTVAAGCSMITCPANVTQGNDPGQCGAVVSYPAPTGEPGCDPIVCSPVSGSFFPVGTTTVNCQAQAGGNGQQGAPTCSFTVTVNDTQPPSITCPANVTQANDANQCGAVVNYAAPTVSDNCPGVGMPVCAPAPGSFFPVGTTTVTCTVSDASANSPDATCMFTVTVQDTQAPSITCPANVTQSNDANQCGAVVNSAAPTASDNCPGVTVLCAPTAGSFFPRGTTTVTCTASDASANSPDATCMFTVTVNDTQPPSITCPANVTTTGTTLTGCTFAAVVTYPAPAVSDNCPGVTVVCLPASGTTFGEGTTTVTCTATDTTGNTATCSFTVTVTGAGLFGACAVDDASGDTWSIVTDPASPLFRFWRYRVAATGELFCGTASAMAFYPTRSLTATDNDDVRFFMNANLNYGANAGTVRVVDYATGRQFVLRDRNLSNDPPCQ
jgi:subtilisin-like proprotein convertase family protein